MNLNLPSRTSKMSHTRENDDRIDLLNHLHDKGLVRSNLNNHLKVSSKVLVLVSDFFLFSLVIYCGPFQFTSILQWNIRSLVSGKILSPFYKLFVPWIIRVQNL